MFELPAVLLHDHERDSSLMNTKAFFRSLEAAEVAKLVAGTHASPDQLRYVEKVVRESHLKGQSAIEEYIGLVSRSIFDSQGSLLGDAAVEVQYRTGSKPKEPTDPGVGEEDEEEAGSGKYGSMSYDEVVQVESMRPMSTVGKHIVALQAGLELLPRNTCRPQVFMDDLMTQGIVHDSQTSNSWDLSADAKQILMRSNYRAPLGLRFCLHEDQWANHNYMRRRNLQVMTNILYICLERRDYARAWSALACLLREPRVDVRLLWMPALQLLAWKYSEDPFSKRPDDFLDWLIANFPQLPQFRSHVHRLRPRARVFMPTAIMVKLANAKYAEALRKAEEAVNSAQYTNEPVCWALCGLAALKVDRPTSQNQALKCFKKCLELGGVLPKRLRKLVGRFSVENEALKREVAGEFMNEPDTESEPGSETEAGSESGTESEADSEAESAVESESSSGPESESTAKRELGTDANSGLRESSVSHGTQAEEQPSPNIVSKRGFEDTDSPEKVSQAKRHKSEQATPSQNNLEDEHEELPSSQPFFSQALTLGGEMGSSDSEDDDLL